MCMNARTHTTSHLHGTQWCWECDVHLDSSARRLVLLTPHQSYSASPAVQETKPEEEDRKKRECDQRTTINYNWWHPSHASCISPNLIWNSKKHLRVRNHERLAQNTPSKVRYFYCDAHETDIILACRTETLTQLLWTLNKMTCCTLVKQANKKLTAWFQKCKCGHEWITLTVKNDKIIVFNLSVIWNDSLFIADIWCISLYSILCVLYMFM